MADKSFGVKEIELIGASGTPTIESPNNLDIKAVNVAISTDITVGGMVSLGAGTSISSPGTNVLTFGTNSTEKVRILSNGRVAIGGVTANSLLDVHGGDGISITSSGDTFLQSRTTGTTGTNYLEFKDSGGGSGAISYHHNGDSMRFKTAGSERARITDVGDLLLSGLTSKNDGRNAKGITLKSSAGISFQNYGSNGSRNWRIRPDDLSNWGSLEFSVSPTDNNNTDWPDAAGDVVLELKKDKDVVVKNGNLNFGTSGNGISFAATSDASGKTSELLDDYEEGTWTPTVLSAGSIGSPQYTCTYTKIGRLVTINADIHALTNTTSSSTIVCGGLPYIPSTTGGEWCSVCMGERYDSATIVAFIQYDGGWRIRFRTGVGSSNYADLTHAAINDNGTDNNLRFTLTYEVL